MFFFPWKLQVPFVTYHFNITILLVDCDLSFSRLSNFIFWQKYKSVESSKNPEGSDDEQAPFPMEAFGMKDLREKSNHVTFGKVQEGSLKKQFSHSSLRGLQPLKISWDIYNIVEFFVLNLILATLY